MAKVTMPQLGETVAEGTVTKWFKAVGDDVVKGEALFEVSTDKVDTEIPAPSSGTLRRILVAEGDTVDVGTTLAIIGDDDEVEVVTPPAATPPPLNAASDHVNTDGAARLSPVVRRLLEQHHLDAHTIVGTGPDGRLTRGDVERAAAAAASDDTVLPFTKIRRLTAEHMVRSKASSAHTLMVREVDYESVENVRRLEGEAFKAREGFSLTYLPFIAAAVADALQHFPTLNASVGDDALVLHRRCNLGIAVDLDGDGLVVPVIAGAESLNLVALARAIRDVAARARAKTLEVRDFEGGTFTITNPGPYGTLMTGAIINQPQVAILATDAVTRRPVVVTSANGDETISVHSRGMLALTFDHRANDGSTAARFLARVATVLDERDWRRDLSSP